MAKKEMAARRAVKIKRIKDQIKNGTYDWKKAIEGAADKIINYPQALLWR